jgi:cytosine/adenosine deaminase-related metal-dependent hydrolase
VDERDIACELAKLAEYFEDKAHMLEVELEAVEWERDSLKRQLAERDATMREAEKLLREIQSAGVSFEDERVAYVEIQVHKETLRAIDAYLERGEQRG